MGFVLAGPLLLARTPVDATYVGDLLPPMILIGVGAGLGFPSLMTLAMPGVLVSIRLYRARGLRHPRRP
jgi:hypothetical protein